MRYASPALGLLAVLFLQGCATIKELPDVVARSVSQVINFVMPQKSGGVEPTKGEAGSSNARPAQASVQARPPASVDVQPARKADVAASKPLPNTAAGNVGQRPEVHSTEPAVPPPLDFAARPQVIPAYPPDLRQQALPSLPAFDNPCAPDDSRNDCLKSRPASTAKDSSPIRLQIDTANKTFPAGRPVSIWVQTTIPTTVTGTLTLRVTGKSGGKTIFTATMLLKPPYQEKYLLNAKVSNVAGKVAQPVTVTAELASNRAVKLASTEHEFPIANLELSPCCKTGPDVAAPRREPNDIELVKLASAACENPQIYETYKVAAANMRTQFPEGTTNQKAAVDAYIGIKRKVNNNRDTYAEYQSYLKGYPASPCAGVARNGTTVAYWRARDLRSYHNVTQLDAALFASKNPREIDDVESRLVELANKGNPAALLRKAIKQFNAGKAGEAAKILTALEKTNPSRDVFLYLGHVSTPDCKKASDYFSKAIKEDSSCAECYFHRAECQETLGRNNEAKEGFKKTLELADGQTDKQSVYYKNRSKQRLGLNR